MRAKVAKKLRNIARSATVAASGCFSANVSAAGARNS